MMCGHCEARVRKALEAIDGIESAAPDHNSDSAVITLSKAVPVETIRAAAEAQDYTFMGTGDARDMGTCHFCHICY